MEELVWKQKFLSTFIMSVCVYVNREIKNEEEKREGMKREKERVNRGMKENN